MELPLKGIKVLEFSQYLSGPCAGLRLADLGAEVIKIEKPDRGDAGRHLSIENLWIGKNSLLFNTINRNKKSIEVDLKDRNQVVILKKIIERADIVTQNFRPGVMDSIGLGYKSVQQINPRIIYVTISGYGEKGPWKLKPGQDLLAQSLSGLAFTTGNENNSPTAFGVSIGDYFTGNHAVQGILAALIRRQKSGTGAHIELSLMESLIDLQFEVFTTFFKTHKQPKRSLISNAHPLLGAPYGIYKTADGYLAIAMMPLDRLNILLQSEELTKFTDKNIFSKRDEMKAIVADCLIKKNNSHWINLSIENDLWVKPVLNWNQLRKSTTYQLLELEQYVETGSGNKFITTRCPIRINKKKFISQRPAPFLGQENYILSKKLKKIEE